MAGDRVNQQDVASELPAASGALQSPPAETMPQTLVGRLVPVVDRARQIAVRLGARVYRVFLVHGEWTGAERGIGDLRAVSESEILPVPRIRDLATKRAISAVGLEEVGDVVIDRISPRYAEDDLIGRVPIQIDPNNPRSSGPAHEFWWEIIENRPQDPKPVRRRFSPPTSTPFRTGSGLQWQVVLTKQDGDRARNGDADAWQDP